MALPASAIAFTVTATSWRMWRWRAICSRLPCWLSVALLDRDGHAVGFGIEDDCRFALLELPDDAGNLVLEREFPLAVVRAFAQHERFHHGVQKVGRQFTVRHFDRLWILFAGHSSPA